MKLADRIANQNRNCSPSSYRHNNHQQQPQTTTQHEKLFEGVMDDQDCQQQQADDRSMPSSSGVVMPGYVKQMINKFSLPCSRDYSNALPGGSSFKVPLLHSTRSSFKSEKPKPFHYPVLLANRSSIPTKPYSSKNCSKNVSNGSAYEDNVITKHVTSFVSVVGTNCNNQQNSNSNEESCKNIETSYHTTSNYHQHSNNNNSNKINSFNFNNNNNNNNNNTDYNDNNSSNVNVDFQINNSTIVTNGASNSEGNSKHTISTTSKATDLSNEPNNGKCVNENSDNLITNLKLSDVNLSITDSSLTDSEKNGEYFLNLTSEKENLLNEKCSEYSSILLTDIPDDASGKIRAAIGKANLLITKKFKQFRELCITNLTTTSADQFHVTTTDLEGFWDLVIIQVDDVEASFKELNEIRDNGWKEKIKEEVLSPSIKFTDTHGLASKKQEATTTTSTSNSATSSTSKAVDRNKEKLRLQAAMKAGRRQRKTSNSDDVVIFIAEKS